MTWETFTDEQLKSAIEDARRAVTKRRERLAAAEAKLARLLEIKTNRRLARLCKHAGIVLLRVGDELAVTPDFAEHWNARGGHLRGEVVHVANANDYPEHDDTPMIDVDELGMRLYIPAQMAAAMRLAWLDKQSAAR